MSEGGRAVILGWEMLDMWTAEVAMMMCRRKGCEMERGMSSRKGLRSGPSWAARSLHTLSATFGDKEKGGVLVSRVQFLLLLVKLVGPSWNREPTAWHQTGRGEAWGKKGDE